MDINNDILSTILCGCESKETILRVKQKFRVFQNKVLRQICAPKTERDDPRMLKVAYIMMNSAKSMIRSTLRKKLNRGRLGWACHLDWLRKMKIISHCITETGKQALFRKILTSMGGKY